MTNDEKRKSALAGLSQVVSRELKAQGFVGGGVKNSAAAGNTKATTTTKPAAQTTRKSYSEAQSLLQMAKERQQQNKGITQNKGVTQPMVKTGWQYNKDGSKKTFDQLSTSEVFAWINTLPKEERGATAAQFENDYLKNPGSTRYDPYYTSYSNNDAARQLFGVDVFDQEFIDNNRGLLNYLTFTDENYTTPKKPGKYASEQEKAAYEYWQIANTYEETTRNAEEEYAQLRQDVQDYVKAWQADGTNYLQGKTLTADDVLNNIDWGNYKTLSNMREASHSGNGRYLNRPVQVGDASIRAMVNAAMRGEDVTQDKDFLWDEGQRLINQQPVDAILEAAPVTWAQAKTGTKDYLFGNMRERTEDAAKAYKKDAREVFKDAEAERKEASKNDLSFLTGDTGEESLGDRIRAIKEKAGMTAEETQAPADAATAGPTVAPMSIAPTATAAPEATATPAPTAAPEPTDEPRPLTAPTATGGEDTNVPSSAQTPEPTATATATPAPTATPRPTMDQASQNIVSLRETEIEMLAEAAAEMEDGSDEQEEAIDQIAMLIDRNNAINAQNAETGRGLAGQLTNDEMKLFGALDRAYGGDQYDFADKVAAGDNYVYTQSLYGVAEEPLGPEIPKDMTYRRQGYSDAIASMRATDGLSITLASVQQMQRNLSVQLDKENLTDDERTRLEQLLAETEADLALLEDERSVRDDAEARVMDELAEEGLISENKVVNYFQERQRADALRDGDFVPVDDYEEFLRYRMLPSDRNTDKEMVKYNRYGTVESAVGYTITAAGTGFQDSVTSISKGVEELLFYAAHKMNPEMTREELYATNGDLNAIHGFNQQFSIDMIPDDVEAVVDAQHPVLALAGDVLAEVVKMQGQGVIGSGIANTLGGVPIVNKLVTATSQNGFVRSIGIQNAPFMLDAFANTVETARNDGANEDQAFLSGLLTGVLSGSLSSYTVDKLEGLSGSLKGSLSKLVGSKSMQTAVQKGSIRAAMGDAVNAVFAIAKSFGSEGLEEAIEEPIQGGIAKLVYDRDRKWFGEGGVFDPEAMKQSFLMGGLVGGSYTVLGAFSGSLGRPAQQMAEQIFEHVANGANVTREQEAQIISQITLTAQLAAREAMINDRMAELVETTEESEDVRSAEQAAIQARETLDAATQERADNEQLLSEAVAAGKELYRYMDENGYTYANMPDHIRENIEARNKQVAEYQEAIREIDARISQAQNEYDEAAAAWNAAIDAFTEQLKRQARDEVDAQMAEWAQNGENEYGQRLENEMTSAADQVAQRRYDDAMARYREMKAGMESGEIEYDGAALQRGLAEIRAAKQEVQTAINNVVAQTETQAPAETDGETTETEQTAQQQTKSQAVTKAAETKAGVVRNFRGTVTAEQERQLSILDALGRRYGIEFDVMDDITGANAAYLGGRRIAVSLDATDQAYVQAGVHEMVHYVRGASEGGYALLEQTVLTELQKNEQFDLERAIEERILQYQGTQELSRDDAIEEIVAEAIPALFADEDAVRRLVQSDRNLAQKIRDFFVDFAKELNRIARQYGQDSGHGEIAASIANAEKGMDTLMEYAAALDDAMGIVQQNAVDLDPADMQAANDVGIEISESGQTVYSAADAAKLSLRTLSKTDYITERDKAAEALAKKLNMTVEDVQKYIDNMTSVAATIAADQGRLDFEAETAYSPVKHNSDYKYTVDFSTLCKKRLLYTGTFDAIQSQLVDTVLTSDDYIRLRDMMAQKGYEVACAFCYVESRRKDNGRIINEFLNQYKAAEAGNGVMELGAKGRKTKFKVEEGFTPTIADFNTTDGFANMMHNHPEVYAAYMKFMNARGVSKPKLIENRTDYEREILDLFKHPASVKAMNRRGGLRLQSFSDFEVVNLLDMMQVVTDMSRVGLMSQAYTKVPAFARIFGETGVKINLSLVTKGLDEQGNLIFDDVEGMPHEEAFDIRNNYSENCGTILVGKDNATIEAAMADPRIDFIIPYHKSGWSLADQAGLGIEGYEDYTDQQNEVSKSTGKTVKGIQPSEYWDDSKTGDENAAAYLELCEQRNRTPKFPQFAGKPGYWKMLIDFKMYDNEGNSAPQRPVRPDIRMDKVQEVLDAYKGGHQRLPVAQDIVQEFLSDYQQRNPGVEIGDAKKFSLKSPVERKGNLVAVHNLDVDNLLKVIRMNGFAAPSIAVTKSGLTSTAFGGVTIVFDKNVVDPKANSKNRLYARDAYTPMVRHARDVHVINAGPVNQLREQLAPNMQFLPDHLRDTVANYLDGLSSGRLVFESAEELVQDAMDMKAMKAAYLVSASPKLYDAVREYESFKYYSRGNAEAKFNEWLDETLEREGGFEEWIRASLTDAYGGKSVKVGGATVDATAENIVNSMYENASEKANSRAANAHSLAFALAKSYNSIKAAKKDMKLLGNDDARYDKLFSTDDTLENWLAKVEQTNGKRGAYDALYDAAYNGATTAGEIRKAFKAAGWTLDRAAAREAANIFAKINSIVTPYFEAKPGYVVGLDNVKAVLIPDNVDAAALEQIRAAFGNVIEYPTGDNEARLAALNGLQGVKFSLKSGELQAEQDREHEELQAKLEEIDEQIKSKRSEIKRLKGMEAQVDETAPDRTNESELERLEAEKASLEAARENLQAQIKGLYRERYAGIRSQEYRDKARAKADEMIRADEYDELVRQATGMNREELIQQYREKEEARGNRSADQLAGKLARQFRSTMARTEITSAISGMIDAYGDEGSMKSAADRLARDMIDQSLSLDKSHREQYGDLLNRLRTTGISLTETQKQEVASSSGSYNDWRMSVFGSVRIKNDGTSLDRIWSELSAAAPEYFPADTNEAEMPAKLAEFVQKMRPKYVNRYGMDAGTAAAELSMRLQAGVYEMLDKKDLAESLTDAADSLQQNNQERYEKQQEAERQERMQEVREIAGELGRARKSGDDAALTAALNRYRQTRQLSIAQAAKADTATLDIEYRNVLGEAKRIGGMIAQVERDIEEADVFNRRRLDAESENLEKIRESLYARADALRRQRRLELNRAYVAALDEALDQERKEIDELMAQYKADTEVDDVLAENAAIMTARAAEKARLQSRKLAEAMRAKGMVDFNVTSTIAANDLVESFKDVEPDLLHHHEMAKEWEAKEQSATAQLESERRQRTALKREKEAALKKGDKAGVAAINELLDNVNDRIHILESQKKLAHNKAQYSQRVAAESLQKALREGKLPQPIMERVIGICSMAGRTGKINSAALVQAAEAHRENWTFAARVWDDIFGEYAPMMRAIYYDPVMDNETTKQKWMAQWRERIDALKLTKEESKQVQEAGEGRLRPDEISERVASAVQVFREFYDEAYAMADNALARNGYRTDWGKLGLGRVKGYFPHFDQPKTFWDKLGIPMDKPSLPTEINGQTANRKPGRRFSTHVLSRTGNQTDYDALYGFEHYIGSMADVIFHTDDIQRHRQLSAEIRAAAANGSFGRTERDGTTHLSEFVKWLDEYTNILAGKKSSVDRPLEAIEGRPIYRAFQVLKSQRGAGAVLGNLASAISNAVPVTQIMAECPVEFEQAMALQMIEAVNGRQNRPESQFKIRKFGSDSVIHTAYTRFGDVAGWAFNAVDHVAVDLVVNTYYLQGINMGMDSETAMRRADDKAARLMGDRSKGALPNVYASQLAGAITQFQAEVANQSQHFRKDVWREYGALKGLWVVLMTAITGHLFNNCTEKITGRRPAADPIDMAVDAVNVAMEERSFLPVLQSVYNNMGEMLPYTGGGRIAAVEPIGAVLDAISEQNGSAIGNELVELAFSYIPAGGQMNKTRKGATALAKGGYYSSNGKQLRFPVESTDPWVVTQALVFGPTSINAAVDYYAGEAKGLTAAQTRNYELGRERGMTSTEAYENEATRAEAAKLQETADDAAQAAYEVERKRAAGIADADMADDIKNSDTSKVDEQREEAKTLRSETVPTELIPDAWVEEQDQPAMQNAIRVWQITGKEWAMPEVWEQTKSWTVDDVKVYAGPEVAAKANEAYKQQYDELMSRIEDPDSLTEDQLDELHDALDGIRDDVNKAAKEMAIERQKGARK